MDYQHILNKAKDKYSGDFDYIIQEIENCIASGSTGGEISSMVGKYLKDLKIKNNVAYLLLEKDIQSYLNECKKQGLEII